MRPFVGPVAGSILRIQCDFDVFSDTIPYDTSQSDRAYGTGFLVRMNDRTMILTAHHVVADATRVTCTSPGLQDGEARDLRILGYNPYLDVAVLTAEADVMNLPAYTVGTAAVLKPGSTVVSTGFADATLYPHTTEGQVSGHTDWPHNRVQTTTPINRGNSGGPILYNNRVVGIVTSGMDHMENTNFFTPIDEAALVVGRIANGRIDLGLTLNAIVVSVDAAACGGLPGGALVVAASDETQLRAGDVLRSVTDSCGNMLQLDAQMRVQLQQGWTHNAVDFRNVLDTLRYAPSSTTLWKVRVRRDGREGTVQVRVGPSRIRFERLLPDCVPVQYLVYGGLVIQMLSLTHVERDPDTYAVPQDPEDRLHSYPVITHVMGGSPFATNGRTKLVGKRVRSFLDANNRTRSVRTLRDIATLVAHHSPPLILNLQTGRVGCTLADLNAFESNASAVERGLHTAALSLARPSTHPSPLAKVLATQHRSARTSL